MPHYARTALEIGPHGKRGGEATGNLRRDLRPESRGGPFRAASRRVLFLRDENGDAAVFRATVSRVVVGNRVLVAISFRFNATGIDPLFLQLVANRLGSRLRELLIGVGIP